MLYLGTSDYKHEEWVGPFYPPGMPKREWLSYYSQRFSACEIHSTFTTLPSPPVVRSLIDQSRPGFLFSVKAHQEMTHRRRDNEGTFWAFRGAVEPLSQSGRLGCVLAQFPFGFDFSLGNLDYLMLFQERLRQWPLVAEFRSESWLRKPAMDWLRWHRIGFCWLDVPPFRPQLPLAEAANFIAYIRLQQPGTEWLSGVKALSQRTEKTFIFVHHRLWGQALEMAQGLKQALPG